jgi:hypothetical protein
MLTLLRVIAKFGFRLILGRAKALFHVPQFMARTRAVDSSICRRLRVSHRSASGGRSRRHDRLARSLRGGRRSSADLDRVMDAACGRHRGCDSNQRHRFWTPIRFVVPDLRCGRLVAGPAGSRSLVPRCTFVRPQTDNVIVTARLADSRLSHRDKRSRTLSRAYEGPRGAE